ncbi:MAG: hypothetical protein WED34_07185 [Planctomycetales bacterium]
MIQDQFELDNTREKLEQLVNLYDKRKCEPPSRARDVTLRSLMKMINQMKEEIAVFQAHEAAGSPNASSRG